MTDKDGVVAPAGLPARGKKIVTWNAYPPIPDRRFDWAAYFDGEEEAGHYGWGRTEAEAIADLLENVEC